MEKKSQIFILLAVYIGLSVQMSIGIPFAVKGIEDQQLIPIDTTVPDFKHRMYYGSNILNFRDDYSHYFNPKYLDEKRCSRNSLLKVLYGIERFHAVKFCEKEANKESEKCKNFEKNYSLLFDKINEAIL